MRVGIGTESVMKIRALEKALLKMDVKAEIVAMKANSQVAGQPFGYEEIIKGARNRAQQVLRESQVDWGVGVENGLISVASLTGQYFDVAAVIILTKQGQESVNFSTAYFVPGFIVREIRKKGVEFGHIIQRLAGGGEKDPMKYFSQGKIKREEMLAQAIEAALAKIIYPERYEG